MIIFILFVLLLLLLLLLFSVPIMRQTPKGAWRAVLTMVAREPRSRCMALLRKKLCAIISTAMERSGGIAVHVRDEGLALLTFCSI